MSEQRPPNPTPNPTPNLTPDERDRLVELLGDRAIGSLAPEDAVELEELLGRSGDEAASIDAQASHAVASLVLSQTPDAEMPESLRKTLRARGRGMLGEEDRARTIDPVVSATGGSGPITSGPWAGWVVAAAALLLAAIGWFRPPASTVVPPQQRLANLERQPDTLVLPFDGQGELSEVSDVGEIVWNPRLQQGFLRLSELPGNDPDQQQYQLWIFDAARDPTYPVDGGVFNVTRNGQTEYLVPFVPRLSVGNAAAFAVTKERAGGVVVTDKSGLVLMALVPTEG